MVPGEDRIDGLADGLLEVAGRVVVFIERRHLLPAARLGTADLPDHIAIPGSASFQGSVRLLMGVSGQRVDEHGRHGHAGRHHRLKD